jgi:hypothetical protein
LECKSLTFTWKERENFSKLSLNQNSNPEYKSDSCVWCVLLQILDRHLVTWLRETELQTLTFCLCFFEKLGLVALSKRERERDYWYVL